MKLRTTLGWIISLLALVSLACSQAGEVLTPAEATARAVPTRFVGSGGSRTTGLKIGDAANLVGRGFLVNILDEPDGRIIGGQERGSAVVIVSLSETEDLFWYEVESSAGTGWVSEENLEAAEPAEDVTVESDGPGVGDTVYLVGTGFLINLYEAPGSPKFIGSSEKNVAAEILDFTDIEDGRWYLVNTPTAGEGWVSEANTTVEAP